MNRVRSAAELEELRKWSGTEVARFVSADCDFPQYEKAIEQNFSGAVVQTLLKSRQLQKGLLRVGICDYAHQRKISAALSRLAAAGAPDQCLQGVAALPPPMAPAARPAPPGVLPPLERAGSTSRLPTRLIREETVASRRMQLPPMPAVHAQHSSIRRSTSRPFSKSRPQDPYSAVDAPAHIFERSFSSPFAIRQLRNRVAASTGDYEAMRGPRGKGAAVSGGVPASVSASASSFRRAASSIDGDSESDSAGHEVDEVDAQLAGSVRKFFLRSFDSGALAQALEGPAKQHAAKVDPTEADIRGMVQAALVKYAEEMSQPGPDPFPEYFHPEW
jgi:hypothetical protein